MNLAKELHRLADVRLAAKTGLMASVIALAASAMLAQEVGYLDLTDPSPRLNTRTAGHFIGGSCNADEPTARPETTITLMRLDSLGKEITFEARIVNSGKETVEIPWIAHLGDLEPLDPKQPYLYRNAAFVLELTVPDSNHHFDIPSYSYGSPDVAGTIRELHPGEWFVVRGRSRLDPYDKWWSEKFKESTPLNVKTSVGLVLNAEAYTPDSDGDLLTEKCLPLSTKRANQLDLALWPSSR